MLTHQILYVLGTSLLKPKQYIFFAMLLRVDGVVHDSSLSCHESHRQNARRLSLTRRDRVIISAGTANGPGPAVPGLSLALLSRDYRLP